MRKCLKHLKNLKTDLIVHWHGGVRRGEDVALFSENQWLPTDFVKVSVPGGSCIQVFVHCCCVHKNLIQKHNYKNLKVRACNLNTYD